MKTSEVVSGRKLKAGEPKEGETKSNGRHVLREAYKTKRVKQLVDVVERMRVRASRTPGEQLALLTKRLGGVDVGAKIERARLWLEIQNQPNALSKNGKTGTDAQIEAAQKELEIAKIRSRNIRLFRRLGISERSTAVAS